MKTKETNGITLITLVVTIVIILILAGVSITSVIGENGLITKARLAKEITETSSEEEAIKLEITLANMERTLDSSNKYYIGTPLYDRTLENGDKWNIVVDNTTQKSYGTGWNYVAKDTEISNYGKTQSAWLINYENGEMIKIEEENITELSYGSNLAVKDGLILNIDPINMADATSWGIMYNYMELKMVMDMVGMELR